VIERPEMLGRLLEPYKHRVAVTGTHGKTTTTAMIDVVLDRAGLNPTSLIGGDVSCLGGNTRIGGGSIVVTEACEAFASFLHLWPSIAVITNVEPDHLDFYGTAERVEAAFRQFASQVDVDGCVVVCWDDPTARKVAQECGRCVLSYGLAELADIRASSVDVSIPEPEYELLWQGRKVGRIKLGVPGIHNVLNSLAAVTVGLKLGAGIEAIRDALRDSEGPGDGSRFCSRMSGLWSWTTTRTTRRRYARLSPPYGRRMTGGLSLFFSHICIHAHRRFATSSLKPWRLRRSDCGGDLCRARGADGGREWGRT